MDKDKDFKERIKELSNLQTGDTLFKSIMKKEENIKTLLEITYPDIARHLDFNSIKIVDTEKYSTLENKKRYLDIAFEVKLKDAEESVDLYFILEHKSEPDKGIYLQLLSYIYARYEEVYNQNKKLPNIIPMVVYIGVKDWNLPTSTADNLSIPDELKDVLFKINYLLYTPKMLTMEQIEAIKEESEPYSYLILAKTVIKELSLEEGMSRIITVITNESLLILYLTEIKRILDIDFKELKDILLTLPQGGEKMATLIDEAIEYGKVEGKIEGILKDARQSIIDILEERFEGEDISDIKNEINKISDHEFLVYLRKRAVKVSSVDEFRKLIEKI